MWGTSQADLNVNSAWPLTGCVSLGKSTDLSVPPSPLLKVVMKTLTFTGARREDEGDCRDGGLRSL